jgi:hypothetical protein
MNSDEAAGYALLTEKEIATHAISTEEAPRCNRLRPTPARPPM